MATVRADRVARDREAIESTTRFATSMDTRERGRTVANIADVLDEAPGLHARRTGDGLAATTVTLRGAPSGHVTIALDGVVLNDSGNEGVDLALVPPAILERADVYRGSAPVRLGVAGLGGAIELITRAPGPRPGAWLTLGYGSFGDRRALAGISARTGSLRTLLSLSYRGTDGNFTFYNDRGTDLDARDDNPSAVRVNNAGNAVDALYRVCGGPRQLTACVLLTTGWRERGLPGPGAVQLSSPSIAQARFMARGSLRARVGSGYLESYATLMARRDHFRDYEAMVIPGSVVDSRSVAVTTEIGMLGELFAQGVRFDPIVRARWEGFDSASAFGQRLDAERVSGLAGGDLTLRRGALEVAAGLGLDAISDRPPTGAGTQRLLFSPRLGARAFIGPYLELRANLAHLERAPTLPDLYGIGGYLIGNPDLVPETSDTIDAGAVLRVRSHGFDVRVEGAGFARRARDLIVYVRRGALSLKPFNLRAAEILGIEAQVRVSYARRVSVVVSYANTQALTRAPSAASDGRQVPGVPTHDLFARIEGNAGPFSAWTGLSYVSGIYFDEANFNAAPPRALLDAGLSFTPPFARWMSATIQGTNLLDQRDCTVTVQRGREYEIRQPIADFAGYPLPGRAVFFAISVTTESR